MRISQYLIQTSMDGIQRFNENTTNVINEFEIVKHYIKYDPQDIPKFYRDLTRHYQRSNSTIHHFMHPFMVFMSRFNPPNSLITIHDCVMDRFYNDTKNFNVRQSCVNFDGIITVSNFSRSEIINTYNVESDQVYIVPNSVDTTKFRDLNCNRVNGLLYVGSDFPHKNVSFIRDLATNNGIPFNHIGYGGKRVSDEELIYYYNIAGAYVSPSLYEGFNIPLIEAMACNCPVIASHIEVHKEVITNAGLTLELNKDLWLDAIHKTFEGKQNFNKEMKHRVDHYSIENATKALNEVYKSFM